MKWGGENLYYQRRIYDVCGMFGVDGRKVFLLIFELFIDESGHFLKVLELFRETSDLSLTSFFDQRADNLQVILMSLWITFSKLVQLFFTMLQSCCQHRISVIKQIYLLGLMFIVKCVFYIWVVCWQQFHLGDQKEQQRSWHGLVLHCY